MISMTKRRKEIVLDWIERYDIIDYWSDIFPERIVMYGKDIDGKLYKKIIR